MLNKVIENQVFFSGSIKRALNLELFAVRIYNFSLQGEILAPLRSEKETVNLISSITCLSELQYQQSSSTSLCQFTPPKIRKPCMNGAIIGIYLGYMQWGIEITSFMISYESYRLRGTQNMLLTIQERSFLPPYIHRKSFPF